VKVLLSGPCAHPAADDNAAIRLANLNGHTETMKVILAHPQVALTTELNYVIR
jgi:hypothetical protein